ncbi:excalibur calcium-binding domain-containing protein [Mycobacterium sp.]|uniref:excalibur calcium-binding domain-containing protein n=1 Tax=Mycobacterium sp. TaxID=1785 RepID=UPI002D51537A|nr:excalibur calcium-binding domain-containing protein [Mycobacterium sp.]HZA11343.1 excalibur calcium-binding domain-containing protein [Mycobacterium sp.]
MIRVLLVSAAAAGTIAGAAIGAAGAASADPPYANCKAAAADGRYNIGSNDPAYRPQLDRDHDGIACER